MPPITANTSHKKKKKTRKDSPNRSLHSEAERRALFTNSPSAVTPPVVTQTQQGNVTEESLREQLPPSSPIIVGPKTAIDQLPSPQIADKRALSELVSGYKTSSRYKSLVQHKESKKKMKVAKLNDNVLFTFLRDPIVDAIAGADTFKPIRPSDYLKKANNHFEKIGYDTTKSKLPNVKGRSKRIAESTKKVLLLPLYPCHAGMSATPFFLLSNGKRQSLPSPIGTDVTWSKTVFNAVWRNHCCYWFLQNIPPLRPVGRPNYRRYTMPVLLQPRTSKMAVSSSRLKSKW